MALIRTFTRTNGSARPHPSEVDCQWQPLVSASGERLLQLSTYGSDSRRSEPKVSQTIQINANTARMLIRALRETFPGIDN